MVLLGLNKGPYLFLVLVAAEAGLVGGYIGLLDHAHLIGEVGIDDLALVAIDKLHQVAQGQANGFHHFRGSIGPPGFVL
jgi:hypothetical protein